MRNSRFVTRALAFLLCILPVMTDAAAQEGCDPLADSAAMVVSGKVRFTVLTSRMIRIQYSNTSKFEDRATFAIVNRRLPVPEYTVEEEGLYLYIRTEHLTLRYKKR